METGKARKKRKVIWYESDNFFKSVRIYTVFELIYYVFLANFEKVGYIKTVQSISAPQIWCIS